MGGSSTSKENELWNEVHVSLVRDLEKKGVMWRYNINHLKHWTDAIVDGKSSGVGDEPDWEKCIDVVHVPPKNARSSGASSVNSEASSSSTPNSTVNQSLVNNNSPNLLELFILQSQQRMEIEAKRADVFQSTLLAMMSSSFKPQVIFFFNTVYLLYYMHNQNQSLPFRSPLEINLQNQKKIQV